MGAQPRIIDSAVIAWLAGLMPGLRSLRTNRGQARRPRTVQIEQRPSAGAPASAFSTHCPSVLPPRWNRPRACEASERAEMTFIHSREHGVLKPNACGLPHTEAYRPCRVRHRISISGKL